MTLDLKRAEHHFASDLDRGGTGMNKRDYSDPAKLRWYPDISCPTCGRTEIDLIGLAQEEHKEKAVK